MVLTRAGTAAPVWTTVAVDMALAYTPATHKSRSIRLQEAARVLAARAGEAFLARALAAFFPAASAGFFLFSFSNYSMNLHNFCELVECVFVWNIGLDLSKNMLSGKGGKCFWEEGMLSQTRHFLCCFIHVSLSCKTDFQLF